MSENISHQLTSFPWCHPSDLIGGRHLLVIAPHPDDESLGCGGLLAWAAATNRRPRVLFLTNGEASHPGSVSHPPTHLANVRQLEAIQACLALGLVHEDVAFLGLPDSGLSALDKDDRKTAVADIRKWIDYSPRAAVCVTALTDAHSDHVEAYRLTREALFTSYRHQMFAYPVWTWMRGDALSQLPSRGWRLDVEQFARQKSNAVKCHATQHGTVVTDSSEPFVIPDELLKRANQGYEVLMHANF